MSELCREEQRYLLVVSGPSGCGKDTVVGLLREKHPEIELSVSVTTRRPRENEQHGVHYYFLTQQEFEDRVERGDLLEYTRYVGKCYGTLRSEVEERMHSRTTCVLVIEVEGAASIKRLYPECTTVFILPPSEQELARRLRGRASEDEEWVRQRLARAREEMKLAPDYDYRLVNERADVCADALYEILKQRQEGC